MSTHASLIEGSRPQGPIAEDHHWEELHYPQFEPSRIYHHKLIDLRVMVGHERWKDTGEEWRHVSMSRAAGEPSWSLIRKVRREFFAPEALVVQILPPVAEHFEGFGGRTFEVFHLWQRLEPEERLIRDMLRHLEDLEPSV